MRRILTTVLFLACLSVSTVYAAEPTTDGGFWQTLKNKLEKITPQKKGTVTTAVGGVRGGKDQSNDNLYWKGEEPQVKVNETEYANFNDAFQAATEGRTAEATAKFDSFLKDYPQSALREDALLALQNLQAKGAESK